MIMIGYYKAYCLTEPISKDGRVVKARDVVFIKDLKEIDNLKEFKRIL